RVVEAGEDLAFGAEAVQGLARRQSGADHLDRDVPLVLAVGADRREHLAHAAAADSFDDDVAADAAAGAGRGRRDRLALVDRRFVQKVAGAVVRREQRLDFALQVAIAGALGGQKRAPLAGRQRDGAVEDAFDLLPAFGRHAGGRSAISRCSHARAVVHSRDTVAAEMPRTSAVSSIDSPVKYRSSTMRLWRSSRRASSLSASSRRSRSTSERLGTPSASSSASVNAPPPRLAARWARA